jgi:hypothetical protein
MRQVVVVIVMKVVVIILMQVEVVIVVKVVDLAADLVEGEMC